MTGIFLIQDDDELVEMSEQSYDSEDIFQELLAKYPSLLAGDQIDEATPRRWLLVRREFGVPSREDAGDRWSLDHLFLDQEGIPTLIEVKRSSNTQIRREVVGQMLDYAANAVVYWPVDRIRSEFEANCTVNGIDPDHKLEEFLGDDVDADDFWQMVKTNLQAGRIRMLFVADRIPAELRRIVEFLNEQMDPGEVLAVEIKQYVGEGMKTLVPRVIGKTAEAEKRKGSSREVRQWDEPSFFTEFERKHDMDAVATARKIYDWMKSVTNELRWGEGKKMGSIYPMFHGLDGVQKPFSLWTTGQIQFEFLTIQSRPPFSIEEKQVEFLRRLNELPGVELPDDSFARYPSIKLKDLTSQAAVEQLISVLDWAASEIKGTPSQ